MKIISSTSETSIRGIMLISAIGPRIFPPPNHPVIIGSRQIDNFFGAELHIFGNPLHFAGESVIGDDRRDGDKKSQGGRDQRFGDAVGDNAGPPPAFSAIARKA